MKKNLAFPVWSHNLVRPVKAQNYKIDPLPSEQSELRCDEPHWEAGASQCG